MARRDALTLSGYLETVYLPDRPLLRSGSAEQLRIVVRLLDRWHGTPVRLRKAASDAFLRAWLASLARDRLLGPATLNSKRRAILTLLRAAWRHRLIDELPRDVPRYPEPRRLPEAWTAAQVARLVAQCRRQPGWIDGLPAASWWASLVIVHYYTAPRIGALLQVRPSDLDLANGWLVLRAESQKTHADHLLWLAPPAAAAICEIWAPDRPRLWPWPYHRRTLWTRFRQIVEAAGLPAPRRPGRQLFYRLRRTTLSLLAARDLEAARRQAGHTSAVTTLRHYVDPRIAGVSRAAALLPHVVVAID